MLLSVLPEEFTVCKLPDGERFPEGKWCFTGVTQEERSLVCPTRLVQARTTAREDGWRSFYVNEGALDFGLIGILADISHVLAEARVGIFVISTFITDYIFVKGDQLNAAVTALKAADYTFVEHKS